LQNGMLEKLKVSVCLMKPRFFKRRNSYW
jgi:hypothetical protein